MNPTDPETRSVARGIAEQFLHARRSGRHTSVEEFLAEQAGVPLDRASLITRIAEAVRERGAPSLCGPVARDGLGPDTSLPELVGYDIIDVLGTGAMGIVYEAYQQSTGRRVAIKYMHAHAAKNENARRRFEREVELVARLQHPGVVPIIDSGVSSGHYYYAMEYVEGVTLDRAREPGGWGVRDAVAITAEIARAVEYAHQRGVLHRDLKPQNILVTPTGGARLLDFGLAKAFDPARQTRADISISMPGQLVGTLAYMPPEQARGDIEMISTRSDVYALGVIAYELLTGRLPIDVDTLIHTALARIERDLPASPSSLRAQIPRDLDAVLLMALEKSPERRYATAGDLADELGAVLADRPVRARTPGPLERALRWGRRHQTATIMIAVLLIAVLVAVTFVGINRRQRRATALAHLQLIVDAVDGASRREAANASAAELRLDGYVREIDHKLAGFPDYQALARQRAGQAYLEWKSYPKAQAQLNLALRAQTSLLGARHATVGDTLHLLGRASYWLGRYDEAMEYYLRAGSIREAAHGPGDARVIETRSHIASTAQRLGRLTDAERAYRAVVESRSAGPSGEQLALARARLNLASCLQEMGRYAEALDFARAAHDTLSANADADPAHLARAKHSLGSCHLRLGRPEPAARLLAEALEGKRQEYGVDSNDDIAYTLLQLAELALWERRWAESLELASSALGELDASFPRGHRKVGEAHLTLGWIHAARGEWEPAAAEHARAQMILTEHLGPEHQLAAEAACGVVLFRMFSGHDDEDGPGRLERLVPLLCRDRVATHQAVRRVRDLVERVPMVDGRSGRRDTIIDLFGG